MGLCGNFTANPNPNPGPKQRRHYLLFVNSKSIDNFTDSHRNFKNLNHNEFVADLDNASWSLLDMFDDVNEKLDTWEWIFNDAMNRHAPIVKKRVKLTPLLPWMNNDFLQLMHREDQFKARAKSNILAGIMYKRLRY